MQRRADRTAVDQLLRGRWAALGRAEARLAAGRDGRSVHSGQTIPDERLEADLTGPADRPGGSRSRTQHGRGAEGVVGLVSASHPFEVLADPDITLEEEEAGEEDDEEPAPAPSLGIHLEQDDPTRRRNGATAAHLP